MVDMTLGFEGVGARIPMSLTSLSKTLRRGKCARPDDFGFAFAFGVVGVDHYHKACSRSEVIHCEHRSGTCHVVQHDHVIGIESLQNETLLESTIEILIFELALELFEHCCSIQSFDGVVPDSNLDDQPVTTVDERIPIVHSLTVWKVCDALDLKAKFIPLPGTTVLPQTPHRSVDQTTTAPVVGSFSVWKICQALDPPVSYDPQLIRTTVFRMPHKPIPVVQSTAVFELCKALNLTVKLAPQ
ncbi:hypothetical protein TNCV_2260241 [Trichonephila clavipes]|nr:hypothetical protein TNCV_2260241 [Trichonephila clavipes]